MSRHTDALRQLAAELFPREQRSTVRELAETVPLDRVRLADFDDTLEGPSMRRIVDRRYEGGALGIPSHGVGRYALGDRDVFRPLQYCAVDFGLDDHTAKWFTRQIVEMSSAHLEALVKRIAKFPRVSFGVALGDRIVKRTLDPLTWEQLRRFGNIYNEAKHAFDHDAGTHLFSMQDAVLAYVISRRLGPKLYPLANVVTNWRYQGRLDDPD